MVADQVDVFTRRWDAETGIHWSSDGQGGYTVKPVEGLSVGTQIGEFVDIPHYRYLGCHISYCWHGIMSKYFRIEAANRL